MSFNSITLIESYRSWRKNSSSPRPRSGVSAGRARLLRARREEWLLPAGREVLIGLRGHALSGSPGRLLVPKV